MWQDESSSDVDTNNDDSPINVLDLPQVAYRPTYLRLLGALKRFEVKPPSWVSRTQNAPTTEQEKRDHARYLTTIISSNLSWMTEEQSNQIREVASKRLAERCGRTGAPAMTREWKISDEITLKIHEPPLTGDNLGLKTWASSYLLAKRLKLIGVQHNIENSRENIEGGKANCFALELGSGTGLLGLAAAAVWKCSVTLSDLEEIIPNLSNNIQANLDMIKKRGGWASGMVLDWEELPHYLLMARSYRVIIAADPLYSPSHALALAVVIDNLLNFDADARVIIELPYRDEATMNMAETLQEELRNRSFVLIEQGEEFGYDDWEVDGEIATVRCWWGIWIRQQPVDERIWRERLSGIRNGFNSNLSGNEKSYNSKNPIGR